MFFQRLAFGFTALVLSACQMGGGRDAGTESPNPGGVKASDTVLGRCALNSPLRDFAKGLDAPGRVDIAPIGSGPRPESSDLNAGVCAGNAEFLVGSGIQDMTGPAAGSISAGYEAPNHVLNGIHMRQYARAFAVQSPCNGENVAIVITDTGFMTTGTRQTVLDLIAADPELSTVYGPQNIMLAATHTHSGPGGEAHHEAYNVFRLGYDDLVHQIYTQAIYKAIRQAYRNMQAHPEPARIRLTMGELLDANINRSRPAYANNPAEERAQWMNERGEEVDVAKRMVQLRFDRPDGSSIGILNWFPVHTTSVGTHEPLLSSDNKGLAAIAFETAMESELDAPDGADRFVAAFAQSGHGDTSPNLCLFEHPFPDVRIGCGEDTLQSNAAHGVKQLARAIELFDEGGKPLVGGIRSRLFHVPMDAIEITDPVILDSLRHPAELDDAVKRTCTAALGYSMAAGAEDQRGPSQEGITCADMDLLAAAQTDIELALATLAANATASGYPVIPASTGGRVLGCGLTMGTGTLPIPVPDADYSCHAEKPILFPIGTTELISNSDLPFQVFALGNLALVGLPWEITTTSARRLREVVSNELRGSGIDHVVVASMTNDFVQYLATREEYATQNYEGASTHFGPWTLAAVEQELRKLVISLRDGTPPPEGSTLERSAPTLNRAPYQAGDARPSGGEFGDVILDVSQSYTAGDSVTVQFAAAHPRNDAVEKLGASYLYAERQVSESQWEVVATDRLPEMLMYWSSQPDIGPVSQASPWRQSTLEAVWHTPANLPAGTYRIRYSGTAVPSFDQPDAGETVTFEGKSSVFSVNASGEECPQYPAWF